MRFSHLLGILKLKKYLKSRFIGTVLHLFVKKRFFYNFLEKSVFVTMKQFQTISLFILLTTDFSRKFGKSKLIAPCHKLTKSTYIRTIKLNYVRYVAFLKTNLIDPAHSSICFLANSKLTCDTLTENFPVGHFDAYYFMK